MVVTGASPTVETASAGPDGRPVQLYGACAALADAAAELGALQVQGVPQDPQQRHFGRHIHRAV